MQYIQKLIPVEELLKTKTVLLFGPIHFAWEIPSFSKTVKRKAIETAKFYFFDTGVVRALRRLPRIVPQQTEWGEFFEQYLMMEMKSWIDYFEPLGTLHYWRSTSKFEVDFILNGVFAIEVKSTDKVSGKHLKGLKVCRRRYVQPIFRHSP